MFLLFFLCLPLFPCSYDEEADKVNQYQRLNLEGLEKIEIGKKLNSRQKWGILYSLSHPTLPKSVLNSFSVTF